MATTSLGTVQKTVAEIIRLPVDFGDVPQLIAGASGGAPNPLVMAVTIQSHNVVCSGSGAPTVSAQQLDYPYQLSALFTGGTASPSGSPGYPVTYTITLNDPDGTVIQRTGFIIVNP